MPERLGGNYVSNDGTKRILLCCTEHFWFVRKIHWYIIRDYAGKLPAWLFQSYYCSTTSEQNEYADEINEQLKNNGIRVQTDLRNEKISYKIKENSQRKFLYDYSRKKELAERSVTLRTLERRSEKINFEKLNDFLKKNV